MTEHTLSQEDKQRLLKIARNAVEEKARTGKTPPAPKDFPESLSGNQGAFVTLHKRGRLRGCIGTFTGGGPLAGTVHNMAIAAGWDDPRFPHVTEKELPDLDIEISVLSPLRKIKDIAEIEVGKHGIYLTKDFHRGVLLPQVAVEQGWDRDTFLRHTCIKAGLPPESWKDPDAAIEVFSAQIFGERDQEKGPP